ncbi:MAG: hypothetical protein ABII90_08470 [Bacteroidota bacterium]
MDSGDIIYILIGVAWLVYAFLRKSKARSQQSGATNGRESSPSAQPAINDRVGKIQGSSPETDEEEGKLFFEKMFSTGMPGDLYSNVSREEQEGLEGKGTSVPEESDEKEMQHQKNLEQIKKTSKIPISPTPSSKETGMKDQAYSLQDDAYSLEPEQSVAEMPTDDFDLRNAVIYNEILKRPQY